MKNLSAALLCTVFLFSAAGCGIQDRLTDLVNTGDPEVSEEPSLAPRVYMDEIGRLTVE